MPGAVETVRRARGGVDEYRSFGFDTHAAQFVCIELGHEQVRASQQADEQDADQGCDEDEHWASFPDDCNQFNAILGKRLLP
jgi:hypothetical protein